ncbi:hypothetical protein RFI_03806 [Reticulomyxa filosa]|uniref:Uncharacterized protein n=1 Tax=Reticulomyxa filosa TaxID=46433 RepID=X6P536_RETFI|nr:hypothetical protein RFI_03806 [Reticulomyxa filosa]|eukprot:ETO33301.1 hypothetical protein RFI_03806 [Reticulomyxa filosa]
MYPALRVYTEDDKDDVLCLKVWNERRKEQKQEQEEEGAQKEEEKKNRILRKEEKRSKKNVDILAISRNITSGDGSFNECKLSRNKGDNVSEDGQHNKSLK